MNTYEDFRTFFTFCVKSKLNPQHVRDIDSALSKEPPPKDIFEIVQTVKSFHKMRSDMCSRLLKKWSSHPMFHDMHRSSGIEQYSTVPDKSICALSGESMTPTQGILIAMAQDDELSNSFKSYFHSSQPSRNDLPICSIQPQSCPNRNAYKPSCKISALHQAIHDEGHLSLPKLKDPSHFLADLASFFHGKRIALVGDSLTRQWFETLSCRLGLKQTWFKRWKNQKCVHLI